MEEPMTTDEPNPPTERDPTESVEVQRYGPTPPPDASPGWQAATAPAWTTRQAHVAPAPGPRRSLAAAPLIAIAVVAGIVSGSLSAVAVSNIIREEPAVQTGDVTSGTSGTTPAEPSADGGNNDVAFSS